MLVKRRVQVVKKGVILLLVMLLFVDDVVVMAKNVEGLKIRIEAFGRVCLSWLRVNVAKVTLWHMGSKMGQCAL